MCDAVHPSRMMIIRIASYKDNFDVYVTNAGDLTIRIVLNRRDVSGRTIEYMHQIFSFAIGMSNSQKIVTVHDENLNTVCDDYIFVGQNYYFFAYEH
jgi:hypothetical protein